MFAAGYVVEQSHNWSTLYLYFYHHRTYISAQKDLKWSDGLAVIYIYHCRSTYKNYVRCACNLLFPREFPFTTLVQCVWVSVYVSLFLLWPLRSLHQSKQIITFDFHNNNNKRDFHSSSLNGSKPSANIQCAVDSWLNENGKKGAIVTANVVENQTNSSQ